MDMNVVKGNFEELKGKIRQKWGKLTDDDLSQIKGNFEELKGKVQKAYGYSKEFAQKEVDAFKEKMGTDSASASMKSEPVKADSSAVDSTKDASAKGNESRNMAPKDPLTRDTTAGHSDSKDLESPVKPNESGEVDRDAGTIH